MIFVILFITAFVAALALPSLMNAWRWHSFPLQSSVALITPTALFFGYILFGEFVLPYSGGGASMWTLAILFGAPFTFCGSVAGLLVRYVFWRLSQGRE